MIVKVNDFVRIKYQLIEIENYLHRSNYFQFKDINSLARFHLHSYVYPFQIEQEWEWWIPEAAHYKGKIPHNTEIRVTRNGIKYRVDKHSNFTHDGVYYLHPISPTKGLDQSIPKQAEWKLLAKELQTGQIMVGSEWKGEEIHGRVDKIFHRSRRGTSILDSVDLSEPNHMNYIVFYDQKSTRIEINCKHITKFINH